ncbi:xaa-Pro aminopeptidase 1-like isoform X2 [Eriocheir sinensis]|uniref:xaa-Pro aminopeptidase 1-like isoform X2 n=1 Tax=Eriocheir sinensis TaxID=95602 RepID=UPI0021CAD650|nr:xaa-Pro aminopeptidase 1-like isoform X2 [Eriocheir sinensis]
MNFAIQTTSRCDCRRAIHVYKMAPKNTTPLLVKLRALMKNTAHVPQPLHAYIVPSGDAHQSEYIAPCDQRRAFISGFTGSAGTAVITLKDAALWTDGRYYLQASQEMDNNWTLMKQGLPKTPSEAKWLNKTLDVGSVIGVDPYLLEADAWRDLARELQGGGHSLIPVPENLIDLIWTDQPPRPAKCVVPLELKYTGLSIDEKLASVRQELDEENAFMLIITALDEIAYLLNLRGSDIEYNPVFFSYAAVTQEEAVLFINKSQLTGAALEALNTKDGKVTVRPYEDLAKFISEQMALHFGKVWVSNHSSQAIMQLVPKDKRLSKLSPIATMKAIKNPTEIQGMEACHVRDAAALCRYFSWLEKEAAKGTQTEISGADQLQKYREAQEDFVGLSFTTISSVGPNGAIIHYKPSLETDARITTDDVYLCDSGGQYKDGTTDVTRTFHFGTPSKFVQECFTRVLKGVISMATCIFPSKIKGNCLDSFARKALWDVGLDYGHGTGHGIGMYLNVHEGPMGVSWRSFPDDPGLQEGMFLSDEPGYYEDEKFGIRIENIVRIVKAETKHNFRDRGFLTFKTVTLVPIQTKLIDPTLLTEKELEWLNNYHAECREKVGELLLQQGHKEAYNWLLRETEPMG